MKLAKESHTIKRLRQKMKIQLKQQTKVMSKRMLRKISQIIKLKLAKTALDMQIKQRTIRTHAGKNFLNSKQNEQISLIEKLKRSIRRDEKKLQQSYLKQVELLYTTHATKGNLHKITMNSKKLHHISTEGASSSKNR